MALSLQELGGLLRRVARGFFRNRGLMMASAVAFNMLLSSIPMIILALLASSVFIEQHAFIQEVEKNFDLEFPEYMAVLVAEAEAFLSRRQFVGWLTFGGLIFFSGMAFSTLTDALSVILGGRNSGRKRDHLVGFVLPYAFILLLGAAVAGLMILGGATHAVLEHLDRWPDLQHALSWIGGRAVHFSVGVVLFLFTVSLYLVVPGRRPGLMNAAIGALTATLLWEMARGVLFWYFANISPVGVIYGSFATVIVVLMSFEFVAVTWLLGAQVVAELENGSAPPSTAVDGGGE